MDLNLGLERGHSDDQSTGPQSWPAEPVIKLSGEGRMKWTQEDGLPYKGGEQTSGRGVGWRGSPELGAEVNGTSNLDLHVRWVQFNLFHHYPQLLKKQWSLTLFELQSPWRLMLKLWPPSHQTEGHSWALARVFRQFQRFRGPEAHPGRCRGSRHPQTKNSGFMVKASVCSKSHRGQWQKEYQVS